MCISKRDAGSRLQPGSARVLQRLAASSHFVTCVLLVSTLPLSAQDRAAQLQGAVTGASAGPVSDALVCVKSIPSDRTTCLRTDSSGSFIFTALDRGQYLLTVSARGFVPQQTAVSITSGRLLRDVVLQPISASADKTVTNTPLNGRDWTQLATLKAGVAGVETANSSSGHVAQRGFGSAVSISGGRPEQNTYLVDGISVSDYANGAPGSVLGAALGIDAVKQVQVFSNNYPPEYGRTSGGVIYAVTRSGESSFHGGVYEFLRNSALDARNYFDTQKPPFRRNQFGVSFGGPAVRNRLYFFADYEGLRQSLGITHVDTVPSVAARDGQLSTGVISVDPAVQRFLNAFYPLPNAGVISPGDLGFFIFAAQQVTTENYLTARVDTNLGKSAIFGTYTRDSSRIVQPDSFDESLSDVVANRQLVALQISHPFSTQFLSSGRFGFVRAVAVDGGFLRALNPALEDKSFAFVPSEFVGGVAGVPGLTDFSGGPNADRAGFSSHSKSFWWNSFQTYQDNTLIRGVHTIRFGANVERMQDNELLLASTNGDFQFSSLAAFLTNSPQNFEAQLPNTQNTFGTRQTLFGAYIDDTAHIRDTLSANLGLRYEMATVPTEVHGYISNLPQLTSAQPRLGSPYFSNPTLRNFEPRVGLAWSPFGNSVVVHSGFGIFDVLPLPYEFSIITPFATPFNGALNDTFLSPGSFPQLAYQEASGSPENLRATYVQPDPGRNYVMQWMLGASLENNSRLGGSIAYVGSRGLHQPFRVDDFDTVLPTLTSAGYMYPENGQRINPDFGRISGLFWGSSSTYNALQLQVSKTIRSRLQLHSAFTWGKSIDTSSATITADQYDNSVAGLLWFAPRANRGRSDFDISKVLSANFIWDVPAPSTATGIEKKLVQGWQLSGVIKAQSGVPFTPIIGGDPLGTKMAIAGTDVPNVVEAPRCHTLTNSGDPNAYIKTGCLAFPAQANVRGDLGRNILTGPGLWTIDAAIFKNINLEPRGKKVQLQFRLESFNVLNHANFAPPLQHLQVFDQGGTPVSGAGLITATQVANREIQVALKLNW